MQKKIFFLFRKQYLLSALNGLANSLNFFHITHRDFFNLNFLRRDQ